MNETLKQILERIEQTRKTMNAIWEGDQSYPMRLAEKTAVRLSKKAAAKYPLFEAAGILEKETPEQIVERYSRHNNAFAKKMIASQNDFSSRAAQMVTTVAELISEEQMAEMEKYRVRLYPADPVYDLDYWRKFLPKGE